jgi:hypothetical protein
MYNEEQPALPGSANRIVKSPQRNGCRHFALTTGKPRKGAVAAEATRALKSCLVEEFFSSPMTHEDVIEKKVWDVLGGLPYR